MRVRGPGRRGDRGGGFAARGGGGEEDARRILPQAGPAARRLACVANKSLEICDLCRLVSLTEYYADLPSPNKSQNNIITHTYNVIHLRSLLSILYLARFLGFEGFFPHY